MHLLPLTSYCYTFGEIHFMNIGEMEIDFPIIALSDKY